MDDAPGSLALDSFLVCEDVRQESNGQQTLVGVFGDVLYVPVLPLVFPKLAIFVRLEGVAPGEHVYSLTITDETQAREVVRARGDHHQEAQLGSQVATFTIRFGAVQARSWGPFRLTFRADDTATFDRVLRLRPPSWDMLYVRCQHCQSLVPSGISAPPGVKLQLSRNQVRCAHCHEIVELDDGTAVRLTPPAYTLGPA